MEGCTRDQFGQNRRVSRVDLIAQGIENESQLIVFTSNQLVAKFVKRSDSSIYRV
jgi:hypothetical protein